MQYSTYYMHAIDFFLSLQLLSSVAALNFELKAGCPMHVGLVALQWLQN
jgi:hypothetical protein